MTADGHVWAASANANIAGGADEATDHAESIVELSSALGLLQLEPRRRACRIHGDFGFGSTPIVFKAGGCGSLVAAEGKDGALYLWQRAQARGRPGPAPRARVPRDALRLACVGSRDAAALPHDDAGLRRPARRARRARRDQDVPAPAPLDEEPRRPAQCRADGRQQHGGRRDGNGTPARLRHGHRAARHAARARRRRFRRAHRVRRATSRW